VLAQDEKTAWRQTVDHVGEHLALLRLFEIVAREER
jgi:hypothetical protein